VIGSIFLAAVKFEKNELKRFRGIRECKCYSQKRIQELAKEIRKHILFKVAEITAEEISKSSNLNDLEMFKACKLIEHFYEPGITIVVDNWEVSRKMFMKRLKRIDLSLWKRIQDKECQLVLVHNCERIRRSKPIIYKAIALASIIAKQLRDSQMIELDKKYGVGFGNPNEWKSRHFILKCIRKELDEEARKLVRWNWQTIEKVKSHPEWYEDGTEEWYNKTKKQVREMFREEQ